jgi:NAD(P)-dependent dehydrogenase (short-subunit alcohol dehydrogenase family)
MGRLEGKTALITGGGRGIGKGIAQRFAAEGARLVLAQRSEAQLDETVREIEAAGGVATAVRADVSRPDEVDRLVDAAIAELGQVDILANNAARVGRVGNFLDVSLDDWRSYIDTNLTGAFMVAQAVARHMVAAGVRGRIINTGSVDSFASEPEAAPYAASKGGIWLLTRAMAVDLAAHGIVVNMLAPGAIKVERTVDRSRDTELMAWRTRATPLGPHGEVEDVAAAAVFLASDECRYLTGSAITIDGGLMARLALW